jgi:hypothetical protein
LLKGEIILDFFRKYWGITARHAPVILITCLTISGIAASQPCLGVAVPTIWLAHVGEAGFAKHCRS